MFFAIYCSKAIFLCLTTNASYDKILIAEIGKSKRISSKESMRHGLKAYVEMSLPNVRP